MAGDKNFYYADSMQGLTSNAGIYQLSEIQLHGLFGNRPNGMTVLIK